MTTYDAALYYIKKLGWYLVPIPHGKKGPTTKGWNLPQNTKHTIDDALYWAKNPNDNMGVLLGSSGIISLDVDHLDNTRLALSSFGLNYDELITGAPRIKTRAGHDKVIFKAPNESLDKVVLSWPIKEQTGEQVVFELRAGDKFQDVLPPSIHPDTKKPYEWLVPPTIIPELPPSLLTIWREWDTKFRKQFEAACPWAPKKEARSPRKPRSTDNTDNLIGWYNDSVSLPSQLERYGCIKKGDRYLSPTSTTKIPGILIFPEENRFYSHHPSFFGDGLPHDAFDLFLHFSCNDDQTRAISEISSLKYKKEIDHGGEISATLLAMPPESDEEFILKVPPSENLITKWQEFGIRTQDSYPEYHIATMMILISHLVKAEMRPQFGNVGNNMWAIILGNSGTSGKSTACNSLISITHTEELSPYVFRLTNKITPEAFISALAEHGRRLHYSDECAGFLKFLKRDYASDLPEDWIKAYDGQAVSKTTIGIKSKGGAVVAPHPRTSMLWNTVPDAFGEIATRDQFTSGFFLRAFFLMPQRQKEIKRDAPIDEYCRELKEDIIIKLANLCRVIGGRTVVFEESEYINEWKHRLRVASMKNGHTDAERSALNRIYEQARKAAMNLTIASTDFYKYVVEDNRGEGNLSGLTEIHYNIPDKYAMIACNWAETVFYKNSLRALKLTYSNGNYGKVIRLLEDGNELSRTDIGNIIKRSGRQISEFITDLCADYPIEERTVTRPGSKKPTTIYYIPRK